MNATLIYLLPVFGALIGGVAAFVCCWQLKSNLRALFSPVEEGEEGNHAMQVDLEISGLIKKHLDEVVVAFKTQIPMASMFISQSREEKLKEQALHELVKAIPAIKIAVAGSPQVVRFTDRLWRSITYSLMAMGAIVGALLGFIEMGLFLL